RQSDMSLSLTHPGSSKGDGTPHWKMSFTLFALMGDRVVRACSLCGSAFEFKDDRRTSSLFPFSIKLLAWRPWETIKDHKSPIFWLLSKQPDSSFSHLSYSDLLAVDSAGRLWH